MDLGVVFSQKKQRRHIFLSHETVFLMNLWPVFSNSSKRVLNPLAFCNQCALSVNSSIYSSTATGTPLTLCNRPVSHIPHRPRNHAFACQVCARTSHTSHGHIQFRNHTKRLHSIIATLAKNNTQTFSATHTDKRHHLKEAIYI